MYKIVIQVPEIEDLDVDPWQETEDPHGPHIKINRDQTCAEIGEIVTRIRFKHRSLEEVFDLVRGVLPNHVGV